MVSILVPAYNAANYLPQCLDSIVLQTYRDLQIVIIDDGSKDTTWQVMVDYAERDSRIETYHQENQGVAETRNHLLDRVKGEYVLFVDADDWIEPDMVEYLVALASESDAEFVMCDRVINDARPFSGNSEVKSLSQEEAIKDFLRHEYFVGSLWNKLLSSSLLHNERFHRGISYGEDALFIWGTLQKVEKVVVSNRQLYHYRMNNESISHQAFSEKKLSGHRVWALITEQVEHKWPHYSAIAHGSLALGDLHLIQFASIDHYTNTTAIKMLQQTVKENLRFLKGRCGLKELISAYVSVYWYGYYRFYYCLYKLKRAFSTNG